MLTLLILVVVPEGLCAQRPQVREGFWLHLGAGGGTLGCGGCESRHAGLAGW